MEHFLEGITPLRHWCINPNEQSNKYKSSLLSQLTKALPYHFLQRNVPLRHLLNAKPLFMSWQWSAFNEVNDWAPKESISMTSNLPHFWTSSSHSAYGWETASHRPPLMLWSKNLHLSRLTKQQQQYSSASSCVYTYILYRLFCELRSSATLSLRSKSSWYQTPTAWYTLYTKMHNVRFKMNFILSNLHSYRA